MRILHTADWHLGRTLEGRERLAEQEAFLDELCQIVEEERVELLLVAGDVFDTVNPPAAAEELYYDALARLAAGGKRRIVLIAGNHDSPDRLMAPSPLAAGQGIHLIGLPARTAMEPLVIRVPESDELAVIAALPYPSEARLNELLTQEADDVALQKAYSDRVKAAFAAMAEGFRPDAVCVAMSHLFVAGGKESDSERPIQVGSASTVHSDALPAAAQYIALGHLHRPQTVPSAPAPTRYSGSPLAYSFSEAGQTKSVVLLEAKAGEPVTVEEIYLSSGRPLVRWRATEGLAQVEAWCAEGRDAHAWIELELSLNAPLTSDQIRRLRKLHPGIVTIRPIFGADEAAATMLEKERRRLPADELFRKYYAHRLGQEPDQELVRLFVQLLESEEEDASATGGGDTQ